MRTLSKDYRHGAVRHWRALLFVAVSLSLLLGSCVEVASEGPYTTWFNNRMRDRANEAGLIGQPEANVEIVLGRANYVHTYYPPGSEGRTFNYYPYPFLPASVFQVHCRAGIVTGLEMFDD